MVEIFEARRASMAVASLSLVLLMTALDTSIANTSLPELARAFGASFENAQWIVLGYLLAVTSSSVAAGRLGDEFGRRRVLLAGIALFTLTSAICVLAPSLSWLVAARAVQGACAAATMALSYAVIGDIPRAGGARAMGQLAAMSALGTTLGPAVGSLIAHFAPRAIFLVDVPIGLAAFALALRSVPRCAPGTRESVSFDVAGTALLALSLFAYALSMTLPGGLWTPRTAVLLAAVVTGLGTFVLVESRSASPLVPLVMLRNTTFSVSLAAGGAVATVVTATLIVGPFYLTRGLGFGRPQAGIILSIGPAAAALTASAAGRLVERIGAPRAMVTGLLAMVVGGFLLAVLPASAAVPGYVVPLVLMTSGYAAFQTANNTAALASSGDSRRGVAAGLISLSRNFGQITGASVMGAVFLHATGANDLAVASPEAIAAGMRTALAVATSLLVAALTLVVFTHSRPRLPSPSSTQTRYAHAERQSLC
jgi:MFS family permease